MPDIVLKVGLVGLPNAGKTTLFNALAKGHAAVAPYPFTTVEPNVGVVPIPDERLATVARAAGSAKVTPATIELVDIAGLVKGAHAGAGLGNEFLSHVRGVDALLHVVRVFADPNVARAGSRTPPEDIATIWEELRSKDAEIRERRAQKGTTRGGEKQLAEIPTVFVFNITEEQLTSPPAELAGLLVRYRPSVALAAKIEAELAELPEAERAEFLRAYRIDHPRLTDLLSALLAYLSVITFFTANAKEARAWLIPRGATLVEAAAVVHSDFADNFIRAETIPWNDLTSAGSFAAARAAGKVRLGGRDEPARDGEVVVFRI